MGKKVFSVYMGDPDRSNHAELDLPATPWELIDALDKLRLVDGREPYWQVEDIGRYGFLAPLLDDSDLYQFNALAEQLSTFDHVEAIAFEGLVQMEVDKLCQTNGGELTLQRLLDLAYSVDGCHVVPEVRDDAALGRFYVENDFLSELEQVPDSVLELLDYAKIGEKMRRDEHGAMTPNGYVVREAELRQAPPNLGRPSRKPPYMIHFLCVSDVRAVKLYLPAKQAELDAVLDCLEVDSWQEVQLEECDTAMPEMWAFVDMAHTSMEQVNQFAQCLEMLDANGELAAFKAVASQLDIYKLEDAMALTEHLSEYAFEPNIHSLEDRAREELSLMADGPELDLLIRNLNLTAYGADLMYRDRGILSDYGYVHRPDGQPIQTAKALLLERIRALETGAADDPGLAKELQELSQALAQVGGKHVYSYLPKSVKAQVDAIVERLAQLPEVAACYDQWWQLKDEIAGYYGQNTPPRQPLTQRKEFRSLKNWIIREAEDISFSPSADSVEPGEKQSTEKTPPIRGSADVQPVGEAVSARHIPANAVMRLLHHMGQIFRTSMPVIPPALRIDSKRRRRLQEKRMAMGHKRNDHEDEQLHHVNDNTMR